MEKEEIQKRQTAYKVRVSDLISGNYVKEEGWTPNYIITTKGIQISRVNIIGIVIEKNINQEGYSSLIIDDGSGTIAIRTFESMPILTTLETGDIVIVIGRPREYGNEKYIVPEIIKRLDNKKWLEVRKAELELQDLKNSINNKYEVKKEIKRDIKVNITSINEEEIDNELIQTAREAEIIYELVKKLDKGDGASIDEIIKISGLKNAEDILNKFIREGEIFQITPGKVKTLE